MTITNSSSGKSNDLDLIVRAADTFEDKITNSLLWVPRTLCCQQDSIQISLLLIPSLALLDFHSMGVVFARASIEP